jgi:lysophospholipase L1-like esterase
MENACRKIYFIVELFYLFYPQEYREDKLPLSTKQINYIEKNRKKFSSNKISKNLNVPINDIESYLAEHPEKKSPFYFYLILIAIPILFFVLLETGLRLFNYGTDLSMWSSVTKDKITLNPDVARRYFSKVKTLPTSIEDIFDKEKKPNSFRVFILGESSAAGFPYMPIGSFSRYIRKRLEINYPSRTIEVINLGLTAINSYTLRDFIPEVLKQKPDLILIYTGHNEYYGALGVGSMESLGHSRTFVNLVLYLNNFKTTQLVKNFIQWFAGLFSSGDGQNPTGTLMSRMAQEKYIALNSDEFKLGIDQFRNNMRDVLESIKEKNIPVILGTLTSNLKDQKPFVSMKNEKYPPAEQVYKQAWAAYNNKNYESAKFLFMRAKDLDGLRFRAPQEFNNVIKQFGTEFKVPTVDIDSAFNAESPNGIVGDNLMTDHLHPNLHGYQLMGKIFYNEMVRKNYLPQNETASIPFDKQDSVTVSNFPFSKLDSLMSTFRIKLLKNDWPYIDPKNKIPSDELIPLNTYDDTIAFNVVTNKTNWIDGHLQAAQKYLKEKNMDEFLRHMEILIYQYPIIEQYYNSLDDLSLKLVKAEKYVDAYKVLLKRYQIKPNALSAKWLGTIDLNSNRIVPAIKYLEESVKLEPEDLQTSYNLAGALALNNEYEKSYQVITKVISKEPNYPGAQNLLMQLQSERNKK